MKFLILPLLLMAACSTSQEKSATSAPEKVSNEVFKKPKQLKNSDVSDFYEGNAKTLNPALQDETLDRYTSAELKDLNTSTDPLMSISILCSQKDFKEAFELASKSFNQYQKVAAYWNQVANCHLNQGSFRKALLFYNKALEVSPNYVPALNNIGVMYSRQGQDQKALVAFERANKQSKFSKTPRYNLAKLYLTYGLAESALPIFESLLNEAPNDVDALNSTAASYFLMSDYNKALGYFQQIPKTEWSRPEIGLNLAFTLKKLGKSKEASQVFGQVDEPKNANLKRYYAVIQNKLGDAE
jgi:tetratricopeptide (TPR) repeat protein